MERHHDALSDAIAAGRILASALEYSGLTLAEWMKKVESRIAEPSHVAQALVVNEEGPLSDETVVFTGALTMPRTEAMKLAASAGCTPANGVTKKTTLLVVGDQDLRLVGPSGKSAKQAKAEDLRAKGLPIRIMAESDFMAMVNMAEA